MFKKRIEFTFPTRVGEAIVAGATPKAWAGVGQKHTRRNQRKAAQHYRFREGIAVAKPASSMNDFDCVASRLNLRGGVLYWPFNFTYGEARNNPECMRAVLDHAKDIGFK